MKETRASIGADELRLEAEPEWSRGGPRSGRPVLFEVSWEVCAQAGGIYTVLRSKAPAAVQHWGRNYWLLGPYREQSARVEFEPTAPHRTMRAVIEEFRHRGVTLHVGRWLITGRPQVLLVDFAGVMSHVNEMKYYLWKDLGIGTPGDDHETNECVAFGYVVADVLAAIHRRTGPRPLIAHFHEWQAAVALPLLKFRGAGFATIFTTHATLVGRSLSAANAELYEILPTVSAERVAAEHGILHRHLIERAAAQAADVFTTVSGITGLETEQFLGRRPDCLLPNGLNVERFAAPHEFQNLHQQGKEQIHKFVMGHFFPSYTFDLDNTLYLFTAGRYEYRNKGFGVFIEALYELNRRLKADPCGVTVVAFLVTRAHYRGLNVETLNRQAMFHELRSVCLSVKEEMGRRLFRAVAEGRVPTLDELLDESTRVRLKRMLYAWRRESAPTIVTHDLVDDSGDPVLRHLRQRGLLNAPEDPVKVIFHPEFISSTSPVLGLEYDQFVRGCNLGVFPSYYEPWGYTPMECIVRGVPAITSDQSGFGSYLMEHFPDHDLNGMYVARRRRVSFQTTIYQVAGWLHDLTRMSLRERIQLRNRVEAHAHFFDWSTMIRYYRVACRMALQRRYPQREAAPATAPAEELRELRRAEPEEAAGAERSTGRREAGPNGRP